MGNSGLVRDVGKYDESVLSLQLLTVQRLSWRSYNARSRSQYFVYLPMIDLGRAVNVFFCGPHRSIIKRG